MNAVIYARYSSDKQKDTSIEDQVRDCRKYADDLGLTVLGVYADHAMSGRTDHRPEFQRMLRDSDQGAFEAIIVWKLDRFARNRYDSAIHKARLKRNGVKVVSAMERISDSPEGVLLESLLEGMAEYYSLDLKEKLSRGKTGIALKCKHTGGKPLLGYRVTADQTYEIDPVGAEAVRMIFDRYAQGAGYMTIADELNACGYKTGRGRSFSKGSLHDILTNERYIGIYTYNIRSTDIDGKRGRSQRHKEDDVIRIPGGIPAIIDQETWDLVQRRRTSHNRGKHSAARLDYLLFGKVFCGKCGGAMVGNLSTSSTGRPYGYYVCSTKQRRHECDKLPENQLQLESFVIEKTLAMLTSADLSKIAQAVADFSAAECQTSSAEPFRAKLREVDARIANLIDAISQGIVTRSTKQALEQAEAERDALAAEVFHIERESVAPVTYEMVLYYLEQFRSTDPKDPKACRAMLDALVNAIYVFDDRITITYNAGKSTHTYKLCADAESLSSSAPSYPHRPVHIAAQDAFFA